MSDYEQVPYSPGRLSEPEDADIFAGNPDQRCPVILLLDTSGSMAGAPVAALNAGLRVFQSELNLDSLAAKRVEVAVVTFGPVTADVGFVTANHFVPPVLAASGDTPIGRAIEVALNMLTARKQVYQENGIGYYRPWVFLITDGAPSDAWQSAATRIRAEEAANKVAFFTVGVEGADFAVLARISVREPLRLAGLRFADLFKWLSGSLSAVSASQPGTEVALKPPTWATV